MGSAKNLFRMVSYLSCCGDCTKFACFSQRCIGASQSLDWQIVGAKVRRSQLVGLNVRYSGCEDGCFQPDVYSHAFAMKDAAAQQRTIAQMHSDNVTKKKKKKKRLSRGFNPEFFFFFFFF